MTQAMELSPDDFQYCDRCQSTFNHKDLFTVETAAGIKFWCDPCLLEGMKYCRECGWEGPEDDGCKCA